MSLPRVWRTPDRNINALAELQHCEPTLTVTPPTHSLLQVLKMSNNSFDDAVSARPEYTSVGTAESSISINSLTAGDFRDFNSSSIAKRYDPISGVATMSDLLSDNAPAITFKPRDGFTTVTVDNVGTIDFKPAFEVNPKPITIFDVDKGSDRPSRYPLPIEQVAVTGDSALHQLNERITAQAVKKVQDSMTPQEKQQLNKDAEKYAEAMKKYEEEMRQARMQHFFRREEDWPKMPAKPPSMVKYEEAIDKEIARLVKRIAV